MLCAPQPRLAARITIPVRAAPRAVLGGVVEQLDNGLLGRPGQSLGAAADSAIVACGAVPPLESTRGLRRPRLVRWAQSSRASSMRREAKTCDGLVCGRRGPCESVSTGRDRPDHARSRYERRGCTPSRDIDTHRDGRSCARGARCAAVPGQSRGETEGVFAARRAQVLASIEEMRRGVRSALQLDPEVESWTFVSTLPTVCQSRSSRDLFF